jgi:hypothetical protein
MNEQKLANPLTPEEALSNYKRYRDDPWAFLTECVFTLNEVNKKAPIMRFPNKKYLELYVKVWQKRPLIAVPKTRRVTMSWTTISLYVWETIFHQGRFTAFVSKKEEDADFLVKRAKFIVDNLDRSKISPDLIPAYKDTYCKLEFPEINSKIQGFPQGADQLRQFTFSGIFGDECAFWEQAERFYGASLPTIDGGGRMTLVSSPAPGFFKKLVFDALDRKDEINVAEFNPEFTQALQGVRVWRNKKNKFLIYEIHYTADPTKRDPSYAESIKNSMPAQEYLREYELHWDTFAGQPVFTEFNKVHKISLKPEPTPGLPMLIGLDWGRTPSAIIGQFEEGVLTIFKEFNEVNMGADRFLQKVTTELRLTYPQVSDFKKQWLCFADPAGMSKQQTDDRTCFLEASKYFNVTPGPIDFETRRLAVVHFLIRLENGVPAFQVYERDCPILTQGFEGGYRYDDKDLEIEPNKLRPIKNLYSHPHDALQYLCSGVKTISKDSFKPIPSPTYFPKTLKHGARIL